MVNTTFIFPQIFLDTPSCDYLIVLKFVDHPSPSPPGFINFVKCAGHFLLSLQQKSPLKWDFCLVFRKFECLRDASYRHGSIEVDRVEVGCH